MLRKNVRNQINSLNTSKNEAMKIFRGFRVFILMVKNENSEMSEVNRMLSNSKKHPLLTVATTRKLLKSYQFCMALRTSKIAFNPLSANPTKWSNTLKQFVGNFLTNCLSVFHHSVKLALKGLIFITRFTLINLSNALTVVR